MPVEKWLLVCDIDGTLLAPELNNPGLEALNSFICARRSSIVFALNSGRTIPDIASVSAQGPIFRPDWVISGVGSVLCADLDAHAVDAGWSVVMARDWGRDAIRAALEGLPGIVEQESWHQHPAKLSYYIPERNPRVVPEILKRIEPWGSACKCVVTFDYYVDIMPAWGGKGSPVEYLAQSIGIDRDRVIATGDSGNDRDMLNRGFKSIIVSNHTPDLDDLAGTPNLYFAQNPAALGVLEGLDWFGVK
jgi:sucrose-6F-phosphate phosphohydrolase